MQQEFYTLPLKLEGLMHKKEHSKCSMQQSVVQHLHLILTTAFNEFPIDEEFGCAIWEFDFDNLTSSSKLKELIRQSLLKSIDEHENRLNQVQVDLLVRQEELTDGISGRRVKKRMDISIIGLLQLTNEKFFYKDSFFVGPLSY